jgi:hypothetical protein
LPADAVTSDRFRPAILPQKEHRRRMDVRAVAENGAAISRPPAARSATAMHVSQM